MPSGCWFGFHSVNLYLAGYLPSTFFLTENSAKLFEKVPEKSETEENSEKENEETV